MLPHTLVIARSIFDAKQRDEQQVMLVPVIQVGELSQGVSQSCRSVASVVRLCRLDDSEKLGRDCCDLPRATLEVVAGGGTGKLSLPSDRLGHCHDQVIQGRTNVV